LLLAHQHWPTLMRGAQRAAGLVRAKWSWKTVTEDWLRERTIP